MSRLVVAHNDSVASVATGAARQQSVGLGTLPVREGRTGTPWFREHFDEAAQAILDFFAGDGIELDGKRVADIGAGDGIIDLGLALKGTPTRLVGFDIVETDAARKSRILPLRRAADSC
jgi:2-polyprenyl-3-methyl-5-hydroxy-6-metoxy-1,4-benzoquinol methylase